MSKHARDRAFAWYDPRAATGRLFLALFAASVALALTPVQFGSAGRIVCGWDVGALILLVSSWVIIARADARETRRRASAEDPGRAVVWVTVLLTSFVSLFAATFGLRHAKSMVDHPVASSVLVVLCIFAVIAAWALTHTSYTLRYAHLYYRDDGQGEGGLEFPGSEKPCDLDFAYFAFVVGMCFQVSDVAITSRKIRRGVLAHSILSFAYNTAIVALTLNLVFGFLG